MHSEAVAEVHLRGGWASIKTPYIAELVDDLKTTIPPQGRRWNPDERAWYVTEHFWPRAERVLREYVDEIAIYGNFRDGETAGGVEYQAWEVERTRLRQELARAQAGQGAELARLRQELARTQAAQETALSRVHAQEAELQRLRQQAQSASGPGSIPADLVAAYRTLYLDRNAPPAVVQAAYRALALLYHPDHGGDTVRMQALNVAQDRIQGKR